ncbi:hypothetical protein N7530_008884 [Penicillium desertorum]|uniref:Uncharacterized protein n=1 Tax=Penicillium desertorum TaxID=1303715 RepID=A0A9W9WQR4_9EURO|nr:hypothetical protein N7530_008884 [Penicillium desertorum]
MDVFGAEKGRPVILECRREWLDGGSENHRTYYTTPLPTPDEALGMHLTEALTHQSGLVDSDDDDPLDQRFDFIPAHTRHSSYHLAATTYVDLVNDPKLQADGVRSQHCLRLRTKSRECSRAIDEGGVEHSDSRGVCLWPSEDAPSELLALLCPDSSTSLVRAVCDERSLIYSTSAEGLPPPPPYHHMLILINFDPMIRFPCLTSLRKQKASTTSTRKVLDAPRPDLHWSHAPEQNTEAFHLAIRYAYRP